MGSKLIPLGSRVLVEPAVPEKCVGGIYLPDESVKATNEGRVVAVGLKVELGLSPGQVVLLPQYGGTVVHAGGKKLLLIEEAELLGVFL